MDLISIIIPTYNRGHLISRAVRSVLQQEYDNWELLIVDDGSTDKTDEVVRDFLFDKRIKYIKKDNSGATHTRNVGVEHASGEFVTFLDSDDEAKENWLSTFADEITKGAEVVCCGYEYYDHNGSFLKETMPNKMGGIYRNKVGRFTNGGVFILKKKYFDEVGGYDENLRAGQHSELAIRLLQLFEKRGVEIFNVFESLIKVHVHTGPKIRGNSDAVYLGTKRLIDKHEALFLNNKEEYYRYLSVAGVSAIRTKRFDEGKKLFRKAFLIKPGSAKSVFRLVMAHAPFLREKFWN